MVGEKRIRVSRKGAKAQSETERSLRNYPIAFNSKNNAEEILRAFATLRLLAR